MILVGTDDGLYRWFEGGPWLTFHGLQGVRVVGLASPGAGRIVVLDGAGRVRETSDNGLSWRELPAPEGAGRPTALTVGGAPAEILLATRPLALDRRPLGAPIPRTTDGPIDTLIRKARSAAGGGTATAVAPSRRAAISAPAWTGLGAPRVEGVAHEVRRLDAAATPWLAAVTGAGLWSSDDAGASWTQCPGLPAEVYAVRRAPGGDGRIVVATGDGCWSSQDAGRSWTEIGAGLEGARHVRAIEVRPDDPKYLLAGAAPAPSGTSGAAPRAGLGFALYESKDAGKSWQQVKRGFPARLEYDTIDDIRWDPAAPGFAIISLASGECWRTRSNGDWWEPIARQTRAARVLCAVA